MSHVSPTNSLLDSDYAWAIVMLGLGAGALLFGCVYKMLENIRIPSLSQTTVQEGKTSVNKED